MIILVLVATLVLSTDAAGCEGKFGPFIEGAAVNKQGEVFAVNVGSQRNTIGRLSGDCSLFATVTDRPNTELNSIRVLPDGRMLSTDTRNQRVVMVSADGKQASTYCEGAGMVAPNDLALSSSGLLYISGQRWTDATAVGDGGMWLCRGSVAQQLTLLGRTNGIELSPDEKSLYVSEAFNKGGRPVSNKIWRYALKPDGSLGAKTLFFDFTQDGSAHVDVDGMRTDTKGNLYVTRNEGQAVVKFSPSGKILKKFTLNFSAPTNLELGGPQGKTLYAVGRCGIGVPWGSGSGCVQLFSVEAPGRALTLLQQGKPQLAQAKSG
ncbi:hypothetical protein OEZ85_009969 [Tetradesmus obliquus]|uniref:SMP-30/Gluconolactonase/LRE-like region domain-containing protein n=1 Tax=Tetradesmus obliquus TaxID=3088 RepID=A0ABY8UAM9_TETOB|nr:hypothetical protein OEZ85_009969 [Tetradesmus obliquus]